VATQYAAMVQVCLDLVEAEPNPEQREACCWEALHWVHHGKSRTLLESLCGEKRLLPDNDRPLRDEVEARAMELDRAERDLREFRKQLGDDEETARRALSRPQVQARLRPLTE